jgi:hypothetical protein
MPCMRTVLSTVCARRATGKVSGARDNAALIMTLTRGTLPAGRWRAAAVSCVYGDAFAAAFALHLGALVREVLVVQLTRDGEVSVASGAVYLSSHRQNQFNPGFPIY